MTDVKFTGHELNQEGGLGLYHAGARLYDPEVGRFMQQDPLTTLYPSHSPYNYVLGNPLINIDPDGRRIYRKGEGYIHGIRAKELTLQVMDRVFKGQQAQIDYVWSSTIKGMLYHYYYFWTMGSTYSGGSAAFPKSINFGEKLSLDVPNWSGSSKTSEFDVNTLYSFQDLVLGRIETYYPTESGEHVVTLEFISESNEQTVILYTQTVDTMNEYLKNYGLQLLQKRRATPDRRGLEYYYELETINGQE